MNILLIQSDQQRRDSLGAYGNTTVKTPNMDALCDDGVVFDNTFTPIPICAPARASLITGKRPVHHGILRNVESGAVGGRDFAEKETTLAEILKEKGYRSTLCGKWHVGTELTPAECGFEGVFHPGYGYPDKHPHYLEYLRGFGCGFELADEVYSTYPDGSRGALLSATQVGPAEVSIPHYLVGQAIEAMENSVKRGEPFFVRCDFWGPHIPYIIPEPYTKMYDAADMPEWPNFRDELKSKPRIQRIMKEYWGVQDLKWQDWSRLVAMCYGYVSLIDEGVGRLLAALDKLGITDDTAVIYTTDHGGMVGSHSLADKGPHLYEEELRIPLVVKIPGMTNGARSDAYVYNMDLMPTILEIAGADVPNGLDALSLMPIVRGEKENVRDRVAFVEFHGHQGHLQQNRTASFASEPLELTLQEPLRRRL